MTKLEVEHGPIAQCLGDSRGNLLAFDDAFVTLIQRERADMVGQHAMSITYAADRAHNAPLLSRLGVEDRPFEITKRYVRGDGHLTWVTNHVSSFSDGLGPRRLVVTSRSISSPITLDLVRAKLHTARRQIASLREAKRAFGAELVPAPTLEPLLLLYLAEMEGRLLNCSEIADQVQTHISTMVRWLIILEKRGLVESEDLEVLAPNSVIRITVECQAMLDSMLLRISAADAAETE